jgi:ATP phosphoribosyltransferase regulatory subunit
MSDHDDLQSKIAQAKGRLPLPQLFAKLGLSDSRVSFAARFGRNMEYYTGFVFELWSRDAEGPVQVAGGGRYDTLLRTLGAKKDVPAIGCAIRGERVLAARRATGAL